MSAPHPEFDGERFTSRVHRLSKLYYEEILPRFIDRYFRGRGYELVAQMLAVHDSGKIRDTLAMAGPRPSEKARRLAANAAEFCPLSISSVPYMRDGLPCFGEFRRRDLLQYSGPANLRNVRTVSVDCEVVLFEPWLSAMPPEKLDDEILFTIFHEYIHYVESYLPEADRPLKNREEGIAMPPNDPAKARRRDTFSIAKVWAVCIGFVGIAVAGAWVLTPGLHRNRSVAEAIPAAPASPTPARNYAAEAEDLRGRIVLAMLETTPEGILKTVGTPPAGIHTTGEKSGFFEWGVQLQAVEGTIPDYKAHPTMCWFKPRADIFDMLVFCATLEPERTTIYEARTVPRGSRKDPDQGLVRTQ